MSFIKRKLYFSERYEQLSYDPLQVIFTIICPQMGDHVKAIKVFVHKLKDFEAAEAYCDKISENSESTVATKQRLLGNLFEVYLDKSVG